MHTNCGFFNTKIAYVVIKPQSYWSRYCWRIPIHEMVTMAKLPSNNGAKNSGLSGDRPYIAPYYELYTTIQY